MTPMKNVIYRGPHNSGNTQRGTHAIIHGIQARISTDPIGRPVGIYPYRISTQHINLRWEICDVRCS